MIRPSLRLPSGRGSLFWSPDGRWLFDSIGSTLYLAGRDGLNAQPMGPFQPQAAIAEPAAQAPPC